MSKVHHFQRYSTAENSVTNNTLQLLSRIYDYSPAAASKLLSGLTGEPIDIGVEFSQQTRSGDSIPDGAMLQRSFKILIEAKVTAGVDVDQLVRHAATFKAESQQVLLLLTVLPIGDLFEVIKRRISLQAPEVIFRSVTFEDICRSVSGLFKEHEVAMSALVQDFVEYCNDSRLFDQSEHLLRIVPCGRSLAVNLQHGIYFQPSDRGYTKHSYVGLYANKTVSAILKIESVFDVSFVDGALHKTRVQGRNDDTFDAQILSIMRSARDECGYEITEGHRFFCGSLTPTDYRKASPNGIQGARFENLRTLLGPGYGEDFPSRLRSLQWQ